MRAEHRPEDAFGRCARAPAARALLFSPLGTLCPRPASVASMVLRSHPCREPRSASGDVHCVPTRLQCPATQRFIEAWRQTDERRVNTSRLSLGKERVLIEIPKSAAWSSADSKIHILGGSDASGKTAHAKTLKPTLAHRHESIRKAQCYSLAAIECIRMYKIF